MTLRELIAHRRKTQTELAAALGVSQAMVSKWVRGDRKPKLETALRIAGALDAVVVMPKKPGGPFGYAPEPRTILDQCNGCIYLQVYTGSQEPDDPPCINCTKGIFDFEWPENEWKGKDCEFKKMPDYEPGEEK